MVDVSAAGSSEQLLACPDPGLPCDRGGRTNGGGRGDLGGRPSGNGPGLRCRNAGQGRSQGVANKKEKKQEQDDRDGEFRKSIADRHADPVANPTAPAGT